MGQAHDIRCLPCQYAQHKLCEGDGCQCCEFYGAAKTAMAAVASNRDRAWRLTQPPSSAHPLAHDGSLGQQR